MRGDTNGLRGAGASAVFLPVLDTLPGESRANGVAALCRTIGE